MTDQLCHPSIPLVVSSSQAADCLREPGYLILGSQPQAEASGCWELKVLSI